MTETSLVSLADKANTSSSGRHNGTLMLSMQWHMGFLNSAQWHMGFATKFLHRKN